MRRRRSRRWSTWSRGGSTRIGEGVPEGSPHYACFGTTALFLKAAKTACLVPRLPHRLQAEIGEQAGVFVQFRIGRRQQPPSDEDRIGAGQEAQGLQLPAHAFA